MPYELVQQYWLAWVVMLSPRALTTTSESGNSRRAAMDNGESARPTNYHRTATRRPSDQAVQTDKEQAQREQNDCRNRGAFYPAMPDAWQSLLTEHLR